MIIAFFFISLAYYFVTYYFATEFGSDQKYDLIIHYATKFATENIATIGKYVKPLKPKGIWISIIPNRTGASRLKRDVTKLFNAVETTSKAKCRIFQCTAEHDLSTKWESLNKPPPMSALLTSSS